ncbi:MAG TPA: hypothetical protein VLF91_01435 [Candidatus Saccharimonadales bacterium]|nr:hypothetical protein [Candidatus Saccharimonadales bacterium]
MTETFYRTDSNAANGNLPETIEPWLLPQYDVHSMRRPFDVVSESFVDYEQSIFRTHIRTDTDSRLQAYIKNRSYDIAASGGKMTPMGVQRFGPSEKRRLPFLAIGVPIAVGTETAEAITPTYESIRTAIKEVENPVLVVSWLNWKGAGNLRREPAVSRALQTKAQQLGEHILDILGSDRPETAIAIAHDPHAPSSRGRPHMSRLRYDMANGVTGRILPLYRGAEKQRLHDALYLEVDADSTISPDTLGIIDQELSRDNAVFLGASLHYTGGIMDASMNQLKDAAQPLQLLYVTEMMRRAMLDNLPAGAFRGYLSETGLALKLGSLLTLGNFRTDTLDDESFWLQTGAIEALDRWYDVDSYALQQGAYPRTSIRLPQAAPLDRPYISGRTADRISDFVKYPGYEVKTSILGIQRMVERWGPAALVAFDQGPHYTLRASAGESPASTVVWPVLPREEVHFLLDSIYSYFKDCGGRLEAADLRGLHQLIDFCVQPEPNQPVWLPTYIPDKDLRYGLNGTITVRDTKH